MNLLADATDYEMLVSVGTFIAKVALSLAFLLIPALLLKTAARFTEKKHVTIGNAYGVTFVIVFLHGMIKGAIGLWGSYVGKEYIAAIPKSTLLTVGIVVISLLFLVYSWFIASSFEISFLGGIRVFLGAILIVVTPFVLLLGPAFFQIAMMPVPVVQPDVNQPLQGAPEQPPDFAPRVDLPRRVLPGTQGNRALQPQPAQQPPINPPQRVRHRQNYPITLPVPNGFVRLTSDVPVVPGTRVRACWARTWYGLTVKEVNEDDTLFVSWDDHSSAWDGDMPRDQLIILESVVEELRENASSEKTTEEDPQDTANDPESSPTTDSEKSSPSKSTPEKETDKFRVILLEAGNNSLQVAKIFGKYQKLELGDALEFVRNPPLTISKDLTKTEAKDIAAEFEKLKAKVSIELQTE